MEKLLNMIAFVAARINVARDDARERGATATEYAMLVAFIAVVIGVGVAAFGNQLNDFFNSLASKIGIG
jgi:pilus assembly protein Flp/PilA